MTFVDGLNGGYLEIEIHLALGANTSADPSTWVFATDITNRGLNRAGVRITGGRADEQTETESCAIALELFNSNGDLTPRNPMSPYFPLLRQSTPIRVRFRPDGVTWYQFVGIIDALPTRWDLSQRDQWIPITASGTLKRVLTNRGPATSRVFNTIMERTGLVDYWSMEDGALAAIGGSALPNRPPLAVTGTVDFATTDGPAGSGNLPGRLLADFGQLSASGTPTTSDAWYLGFWIKAVTPSPTEFSGGKVLSFRVPGHSTYASFDVTWSGSGGQMILHAYTASGASFSLLAANDMSYDAWHFVMVGAQQAGTAIAYNMWVDGASADSFTHASTTNGITGMRDLIVSPPPTDPALIGLDISPMGCGHLFTLSALSDPAATTLGKGTSIANAIYQAGVNAGGWSATSELARVCARLALTPSYGYAPLNSNPYFETTASPWTAFGSTVARVTTQAHEGLASLLVTPDGVTAEAQGRAELVPVTALRPYRSSAWVRCAVTRDVRVTVDWHNAVGTLLSTSFLDVPVLANTWTKVEAPFTAPTGATQARPLWRLMAGPLVGHLLWLDAAMLTPAAPDYPMGPDQMITDVARLRAIEAVTGGVLYELPTCVVRLDTAADRTDQPVTLTLDYGAGDVAPPLEPVEDTTLTRNDVTATRPDGASARFVLDVGPMSTSATAPGVGSRPGTVDVNPFRDTALIAYAGHAVARGTVDAERYPTVHVDLHARPALIAAALAAARPSKRVKIVNPPTGQGYYNAADLLVEGFEIFLDFYSLDVIYNATPYAPYVGFGLVDAAGAPAAGGVAGFLVPTSCVTTATMPATSTPTSVTMTTVPLWNTDASNFPVDVEIDGEVMRATAVTGAANPQTLTLTRAINGVVKSHAVGAEITIRAPGFLTMEV